MEEDYSDVSDDNDSFDELENIEESNYNFVAFIRENLNLVFQVSDENMFPFFHKSKFLAELSFVRMLFNASCHEHS